MPVSATPDGKGLHVLAAEPDAQLMRPVARINFCKDSDVVRYFVSSKEESKKAQEPESINPRSPARP